MILLSTSAICAGAWMIETKAGTDSGDEITAETEENAAEIATNSDGTETIATLTTADDTDGGGEGDFSSSFLSAIILLGVMAIVIGSLILYRIKKKKKTGNEESAGPGEQAAGEEKDNSGEWKIEEKNEVYDAFGGQMASEMVETCETSVKQEAGAERDTLDESRIGRLHNIGKRRNQEDTLGIGMTPQGLLAVVSDGMGGLADGEKVSRTAVRSMLQNAHIVADAGDAGVANPLYGLLAKANRDVLDMLGENQIYKCGATLLAVLVTGNAFHWIAVGDSRIYFYDGKHLLQLNREHVFRREMITQAVNGNLDFSRIETNTQRNGLVSFLGMGALKYVDGSLEPIKTVPGDRVLLMSDGVFNALSGEQMLEILKNAKTAADAAAQIERNVKAADKPGQDNFTCVIIDL